MMSDKLDQRTHIDEIQDTGQTWKQMAMFELLAPSGAQGVAMSDD